MRYQTKKSPEHCYVLAFDTVCDGWQVTTTEEKGKSVICLMTKEEAEADLRDCYESYCEAYKADGLDHEIVPIDEYDEFFIVHMDEYLHGRKIIFN